jgi:hypothetical protein
LGLASTRLEREPDLIVRFVERISDISTIRYLGIDDVGFSDDAFYVFRGPHKSKVNVQIPFYQIGKPRCEIVCESGVSAVPLLIAIINMTALSKGVLPLHASALEYNNKGILLTGWSKGGKTETLLGFAANGAKYIGDEWIYFDNDGQRMYGIPEPMRVWYWHLTEMPWVKAMVKRKDLIRLWSLNFIASILENFISLSQNGKKDSVFRRILRQIKDLVKRQLYVQLSPEKVFGQRSGDIDAAPEKVFLVVSHNRPDIVVQPVDPDEIAQRMVFSLQEERMEFLSYYFKFRFAFPQLANPVIDQAEEIQRELILKVLTGKEGYVVYHPYPFSIPQLFKSIAPYCS